MMPGTILVTLAIKATVLLLGTWAVTRLMRRSSAAARCWVWVSGMGLVLALPVLMAIMPPLHLNVLPPTDGGPARATSFGLGSDSTAARFDDSSPARRLRVFAAGMRGAEALSRQRLMANLGWLFAGAWAIGLGLSLCRMVIGLRSLTTIVRRAQPLKDREWLVEVASVCAALNIRTPPRVLVSAEVAVPATCGVFTPTLLVPPSYRRWTASQRQVVTLHELAHVRRRDGLAQLMAECACALYWFHPLMWLAASRLRDERERACDDVVLGAGTSATDYADHLIDLGRAPASISRLTVAFAVQSRLEQRIRAILDDGQRRTTPGHSPVILGFTCAAATAVALGAVQLSARTEPRLGSEATAQTEPIVWMTRVISPETQGRAAEVLSLALRDASAEIRDGASRALLRIEANARTSLHLRIDCGGNCVGRQTSSAQVDGAIASRLDSDDAAERRAAVGNLSRDSVPGVEALARALFDRDRLVRTLAARRLDSVFAEAAIPGWIALLRDHDPSLRERAAISLGVIGDPRAIAPLTTLLQDPELAVRRQIVTALATIACGPSDQQELG